jgi:hypothetical protein
MVLIHPKLQSSQCLLSTSKHKIINSMYQISCYRIRLEQSLQLVLTINLESDCDFIARIS